MKEVERQRHDSFLHRKARPESKVVVRAHRQREQEGRRRFGALCSRSNQVGTRGLAPTSVALVPNRQDARSQGVLPVGDRSTGKSAEAGL